MTFEYKVVPAPTKGKRAKGVKTPADRFAHALEEVMNDLAEDGWEYLRTDTLPSEERQGLIGRTTVYQNMLVFRRPLETDGEDTEADADVVTDRAPVVAPAPAEPPKPGNSLDKMIADEITAARAPRLPSADAAHVKSGVMLQWQQSAVTCWQTLTSGQGTPLASVAVTEASTVCSCSVTASAETAHVNVSVSEPPPAMLATPSVREQP